jgi:predicted aldo/keto reductase-like oxidoreductase
VTTHAEVDRIFGPGGALEAFVKAKEQGKVRHIGFTGHADPSVHLRLLDGFAGWETAQFPVNLIDRHYLSFIDNVLPKIRAKGLGVIGMKSNAIGQITAQHVAAIPECLRYSWSQNIDTLVSGIETVQQLEENVLALKTFQPMTGQEQETLLARTRKGPIGPGVERYKKKKDAAALTPEHSDGQFV